jgi:hypothetical protein
MPRAYEEGDSDWAFLRSPLVYAALPRLSPAVTGVTFLQDACGLVLAYDFHALTGPEDLEKDLALGCKVR